MKKVKNLCKIRVKGLNIERILSKLCLNFNIFNIERKEKTICEFEVYSKSLKNVLSFLNNQNIEVEILSKEGLLEKLKSLYKNWGIVSAIILCLIVYIIQYNFVWQIKVYGIENIDEYEIVEYINDNFSKNKTNINTEQMEIQLKNKFDRISSVSVAIVGQSLIININEAILPNEMQTEFSPIYSNVDCKITKIELIQGTLAVKVGEIVKEGDILVYPYILDAEGEKRAVFPEANIIAEVWLIGESEHSEGYYITRRTGEVIQNSYITMFGLKIYENSQMCDFNNYEVIKSISFLSKRNVLPIKIETEIYYELETILIEQPFEIVKTQKIEEARQKALISLQEYDIIKQEYSNISSGAGISIVEYVITVERNIGVKNESLHK